MALPQLIEEDISELNASLMDLLIKCDANAGLLIDKGGFMITQCGRTTEIDVTTLAALAAASFAATETIASLVQEKNFSSVYQQGDKHSLLVINVDENCLLCVIFQAKLSVGAIKYYSTETLRRLAMQLQIAEHRSPDKKLDLSMLNMADPTPLFKRKSA